MADERFSLKDHLFNREKISYLGDLLSAGVEGFDRKSFETEVMAEMLDLELKERIALIARVLADHLDPDFTVAANQIRVSLPPPLDPSLVDDDFGDFIIAPFGKFTEDRGIDHPDTALPLLREITMRFSMEGSIRPFINQDPDRTLQLLDSWARDDNYHVRRLVSEGTRPLLPWAPRIDLDVSAPLPLLDQLHDDPTRYVTRSVANHLNDVSKIEPALVVERLETWQDEGRQDPRELAWITRHALRTLVKRGDIAALELLGFRSKPDVRVSLDSISSIVKAGDSLEFDVSVASNSDERLLIDYSIAFVKKNGELKPKVYKLKQLALSAGEATRIRKRHPLRANATTYTLYPGTHILTIVVNGDERASLPFEVVI